MLSSIYYKLPHQTAPPPPPKPFILFQKPLRAEQYLECYQTSFSLQQEFPLLAALGGAEPPPQSWERLCGLMAPGHRVGKCWVEQLERMSGRDPPALHPVFTHTLLQHIPTSPEAQLYPHMAPRVVLLLRQVLQRMVRGTSDKLPGICA